MTLRFSVRASSYRATTGFLAIACAALLVSCSRPDPRWTPETVRPPESLDAFLAEPAPETGEADLAARGPDEGAGETPAAPSGDTAASASTLEISRDGAILTALSNNRSLQVSRFGPAIGETYVPEARALFDPRLLATASHGKDTRQLTGVARFTFLRGTGAASQTAMRELTPLERIAAQGLLSTFTGSTQLLDIYDQARATELESIALQQDLRTRLGLVEEMAIENESSNFSVTTSVSLPTGTEVFLTGGLDRTESNFTPTEYLGSWTAGINQALLRGAGPAVNLVSLRKARNAAAQSEHEFRAAVLDLVAQSESAYWELVLARQLLEIREFSVVLAEEQRAFNQNLLNVGKVVQGAVLQADAEVSSRRADLADARALLKTRTLALVRLLNPDAPGEWETAFHPTDAPEVAWIVPDGETSAKIALHYRPELAQARLGLANRELDVVLTKNGLLPRLDAFAAYGRTSLTDSSRTFTRYLNDSDYDNYAVGLRFEMPVLNRAERARNRRANFQLKQSEAAVSNLEQIIELEARNATVEVERQWERIHATEAAVASRQEALRVEQDRYSVGMSTNLDVLQVQRDLIEARVAEVTARIRYIEALTALYATEGSLLARRGIEVEHYMGVPEEL